MFSIIQVSFQAGQRYPLANSAILDSGATLHIFNNIHRFKSLTPASVNDYVLAGEHPVKIEGYGSVDVVVRGPKKAMVLTLTGVAFCPTFACNIISVRELNRRKIWWDNRLNRLVRNDGSTLCLMSTQEGQFVVESMPLTVSGAVFQARTKRINTWSTRRASKGDATLWHHRLGHPGPRALEHLVNHSEGTKIKGITTAECDACALAKMKRQIRRKARRRAPRPGERLALDLHEFTTNKQQQRYLLLITDRFSGFSWDYYLPSREVPHILAALKHLVQLLKTQFDIVPKVLESDNEFSRAKVITSFCNNKGIKMEPSAAETPAQNGGAERAGAVIKAKARAMRIGANLPEDLWIEITRAAVYLFNRTPRAGNDWQSPYERFHTAIARANGNPDSPAKKPNNAHLKAYGCKAFAMTRSAQKGTQKTRRLAPRAWVGYLVGYNSSNIFRIWNPIINKVVATRDVIFNEHQFFPRNSDLLANDIAELDIEQLKHWFNERLDPHDDSLPPEEDEEEHQEPDEDHITRGTDGAEDEGVEEVDDEEEEILDTIVVGGGEYEEGDGKDNAKDNNAYPTPPDTPPGDILAAAFAGLRIPSRTRPTHAQRPIQPWQAAFYAATTRSASDRTQRRTWRDTFHAAFHTTSHAQRRTQPGNATSIDLTIITSNAQPPGTTSLHQSALPAAPERHHDLQKHPLGHLFLQAEEDHLASHVEKESWTEISRDEAKQGGRQVLDCMWVYTYKFNTKGFLVKCKARLVVRGDQQKVNHTEENYAATLATRSFRAVLSIAARFDLEMKQFDAVNAFVNAKIDDDVFMELPVGYRKRGRALKLNKALYGLRKSPLLWQKELTGTLANLGFRPVPHEPCIMIRDGCLVFFYVDDIVIAYPKAQQRQATATSNGLRAKYDLTGGNDLQWFLGIEVHRDRARGLVWLAQTAYIEKIAKLAAPSGHTRHTPIAAELLPYADIATHASTQQYQRKVGSILYAAVVTRPDIAFAASRLARFNQNPGPKHHAAADRVLRYLYATRFLALQLGGGNDLRVTCDASFADNTLDRKSSQGFTISLFGGLIAWRASKQNTVTTSTTEAELLSLAQGAKEGLFMQRMLAELSVRLDSHTLTIECDNLNTIALVTKEIAVLHTRLRHVDIHNHWLRQEHQAGRITVVHTPTKSMLADGFTKSLGDKEHQEFITMLNLVPIQSLIEERATGKP